MDGPGGDAAKREQEAQAVPGSMNKFQFDNFTVTRGNEEAHGVCRDIARAQYRGPAPVVLFGEPGAGKSHLLWALLNAVREAPVRVGIGLILPHDFPEKLRGLIGNPAPISQGKPAVLLVDGCHAFSEGIGDLEEVVELFLARQHTVVISTAVHPNELRQFSQAFRQRLLEGNVIPLKHREAAEEAETPESAPADTAEHVEAAEAPKPARVEEDGPLRNRVVKLEQERERLLAAVREAEAQRDEIARERGTLQRQMEAHAMVQAELASLRKLFADTEADAQGALAQQARLQGLLSAEKEAHRETAASRDAALETLRTHQELAGAPRDRLRTLETELLKARKQINLQAAEMDALRQAAAQRVSTAQAQTMLLQERLDALVHGLEGYRGLGGVLRKNSREMQAVLEEGAARLARFGAHLERLDALSDATAFPEAAVLPEDQETGLFEALPEEAEEPGGIAPTGLRAFVQRAFVRKEEPAPGPEPEAEEARAEEP